MAVFRGHGRQQRDAVGGSGSRSFSCFPLEHARTLLRLSSLRRGGGSSKINTSPVPPSAGAFSEGQEGTASHTQPAPRPCGRRDRSLTLVPALLQPVSGQSQTRGSPSAVVRALTCSSLDLEPCVGRKWLLLHVLRLTCATEGHVPKGPSLVA